MAEPIQGMYSVQWMRSAGTCSPQALPAALNADTALYVSVPASAAISQLDVQVAQAGASLSITPVPTASAATTAPVLTGAFPVDGQSSVLSGVVTRTEGPRAGGHVFSASTQQLDTVGFVAAVETPPGERVERLYTARGTETITYREGGPSGSVYTICAVPEQLIGHKME